MKPSNDDLINNSIIDNLAPVSTHNNQIQNKERRVSKIYENRNIKSIKSQTMSKNNNSEMDNETRTMIH